MLEDKIYNDYVRAMKAKEKEKSAFLSFLRAELKNQAINLKKDKLEDKEAIEVLKKQKKKLLDSKEQIEKADRSELLAQVKAEIALIEGYLPASLPKEEIEKIIDEVIAEAGASSMKDMGKVMKLSLEKLSGRADSKDVSQIVKTRLSKLG
jgi:uncharacterized protein YqeY